MTWVDKMEALVVIGLLIAIWLHWNLTRWRRK